MKNIVVYLLSGVMFLIFMGCSSEESVDVNGVERQYVERMPASSVNVATVFIALHGGDDKVSTFEAYSQLTKLQEEHTSIGVVYLEGINKHWNDGRAESGSTADDIAFIDKMITKYEADGVSNIYLVGMSNGGLMVQRAACELGNKIDGMVVVGATQSTYLKDHCIDNTTPIRTMFVFGDADPIFSTSGAIKPNRGTHIGIASTLEYWKDRNKCNLDLTIDKTIDTAVDNTSIDVYTAGICNGGLKYYEVNNGGHRWPDPSAENGALIVSVAGRASHDISTANEILAFFSF